MTLLISALTMQHCTVAPLSAAVTFFMVMLDGFGPEELSVEVILTAFGSKFKFSPKLFTTPVTPESAVRVHTRRPDLVVSQENVRSSPEQASSLTPRSVTAKDTHKSSMKS